MLPMTPQPSTTTLQPTNKFYFIRRYLIRETEPENPTLNSILLVRFKNLGSSTWHIATQGMEAS